MQYVCAAAGGATWFRIETEAEAEAEAALMRHAVDKYFRRCAEAARASYRPPVGVPSFEQEIGLKDHIARAIPIFLTLRADDGEGLATAMLPPLGRARARSSICSLLGRQTAIFRDPRQGHRRARRPLWGYADAGGLLPLHMNRLSRHSL